jgi:hypothetical protein
MFSDATKTIIVDVALMFHESFGRAYAFLDSRFFGRGSVTSRGEECVDDIEQDVESEGVEVEGPKSR